jgi:hypothetical protein
VKLTTHLLVLEVKNVWCYASTPQHVFMEWCIVKHRNSFTFTLTGIVIQELEALMGKYERI